MLIILAASGQTLAALVFLPLGLLYGVLGVIQLVNWIIICKLPSSLRSLHTGFLSMCSVCVCL